MTERAAESSLAAKLPVMVWIYGGGFVNGGSSPPLYESDPIMDFTANGPVAIADPWRERLDLATALSNAREQAAGVH